MSNILILDDEEYIAKLISKIAIKKGHNVQIADNFDLAYELINNGSFFDYIFIDYNIEKNKLNNFSEFIKSKNKNCQIIIMSGLTEQEIVESVKYDKFIFKPDLVDVINKIL
ncbi:MAG: response regulator [Spirochaetales bacterium]|nr:response regulator [Spirochaetales bacterium]